MSDTYQVVQWCLEYRCPMRSTDAATNPTKALEELFRPRQFFKTRRERGAGYGVYGDINVVAQTFAKTSSGKFNTPYPANGYSISKEFDRYGGPEAMLALCQGPVRQTRSLANAAAAPARLSSGLRPKRRKHRFKPYYPASDWRKITRVISLKPSLFGTECGPSLRSTQQGLESCDQSSLKCSAKTEMSQILHPMTRAMRII